jgi:glycosyltransferase involved in cell wall biosynthesis
LKVYFCTYHHCSNGTSGADVYHYNLANLFVSWGWEVKALSQRTHTRYHVDKVLVCGLSDHIHNQLWADIIITIPYMHTLCKKGKPMFIVKHNIGPESFRFDNDYILYCGEAVRKELRIPCKDSFVWNPSNKFAGTELRGDKDGYWLLVNCNENKGGRRLIELAQRYPQKRFAGVLGAYGDQVKGNLPNVEYWPNIEDMSVYYQKACGVLSLSQYEGFPTVLLEAMSFNLPLVVLDIPGVRDVCNNAARYYKNVSEIDLDDVDSSLSIERANEVEYNRDFEGFKEWLKSKAI